MAVVYHRLSWNYNEGTLSTNEPVKGMRNNEYGCTEKNYNNVIYKVEHNP